MKTFLKLLFTWLALTTGTFLQRAHAGDYFFGESMQAAYDYALALGAFGVVLWVMPKDKK